MKTVAMVTQKGGAGKSTTAASLAVAATESGKRVFLLELDRQGTVSDWAAARPDPEQGSGSGLLDSDRVDSTVLTEALRRLDAAGYDLVIIDTPGVDSPAVTNAMRAADLCLIPCRPTAPDLRGCVPTVHAVVRLNKSFAFVLTQAPPGKSSRVAEAKTGLGALGIIAEPTIVTRADHQDAMAAGMGVTEFNPDGAAAAEIRTLWRWVAKKLEIEP